MYAKSKNCWEGPILVQEQTQYVYDSLLESWVAANN